MHHSNSYAAARLNEKHVVSTHADMFSRHLNAEKCSLEATRHGGESMMCAMHDVHALPVDSWDFSDLDLDDWI